VRKWNDGTKQFRRVFVISRGMSIFILLTLFAVIDVAAQQIDCSSEETASDNSETSADVAPVQANRAWGRLIELRPKKMLCDFNVSTDERGVIEQVLGAYGIDPTVDSSIIGKRIRFDVNRVAFADAADLLKLTTGTFFVALSPTQVLVLLDTKEHRAQYERQLEEQVSVPGLTSTELAEMQGAAKTIFGIEHALSQDNQGTAILRGPSAELEAMNGAYQELFAGHSELLIEMDVYEIDRIKDTTANVTLPNTATLFNVQSQINSVIANNSTLVQEIISSGIASAGDYVAILAALLASGEVSGTVFNNPFVLFGGGLTETGVELNTTSANMLLNSSYVRSLDRMQLRVLDHEEATFRSGERYPIITSSYKALGGSSSSSVSSVTVPQVQYQDLGLTLKVKPSIEDQIQVALSVDLRVSSLAGSTINNIPVLTNRQYSGAIMVHFGNSALITSVISHQDVGEIIGYTMDQANDSSSVELIVLVTPHLLRATHTRSVGAMRLLPVH